jgi:hypothetical protein
MQRYVFVQLFPKDLCCFSKKLIPQLLLSDHPSLPSVVWAFTSAVLSIKGQPR